MKRILCIVAISVCLIGVHQAYANVLFDAQATAVDDSGHTIADMTTLTVGSGENRALVVQICWVGVVTNPTVTWDSNGLAQTMTQIVFGKTSTDSQTCGMWGLVNPVSGNKTLEAHWSPSTEINWQAVSWKNVDQTGGTTSFPHAASSTSTSNAPSVTVTSQNGNAVMGTVAGGSSFGINSINQTQTFLINGAGSIESAGNRLFATTTSNTLAASFGGSEAHIFVGTDIQAAASPGILRINTKGINVSQYGPSSLYSGIVGWWTFDGKDTVSGVFKDRSANGNDGYPVNIATSTFYVNGKIGQGVSLNSTSPTYVNVPTADYSGTTPVSVSMWVRPRVLGGGHSTLAAFDTGSTAGWTLRTSVNNTLNVHITCNGTSLDASSDVNAVHEGQWQHVAFTWDGSALVANTHIYVNGVDVGGSGGDSDCTGGFFDDTGGSFQIGNNFGASGQNGDEAIDDVRVYNRVLSSQEVAQLYRTSAGSVNASSVGPANLNSGLLAWYTLDAKNMDWGNSLAKDRSGNANDGTLNSLVAATSPAEGKTGQALAFDNTQSQYIMTPLTTAIGTGSYSYSVWFKTSTKQLAGLISRRDNSGAPQFSINISNSSISAAGNVVSIIDNDGSIVRTGVTSGSYTDGKWHFAVVVRDTNTSTTLGYVDGQLAITSNSTAIPNHTGTDNIMVGASGDGGSGANFFFKGSLDDARIYSRALSAQEVLQLYKASGGNAAQVSSVGPANLNSGLVGWWTFDGKDINWTTGRATDRSGTGNSGQLISMSTSSSPVQGKVGQGLSFVSANSQFVSLTNNGSSIGLPTATSPITYSLWVKTTAVNGPLIAGRNSGSNLPVVSLSIGDDGVSNIGTGKPAALVRDDAGNGLAEAKCSTAVNDAKWHHIVYTRDSSKNNTVYVDNSSCAQTADTMGTSVTVDSVKIGNEPKNAYTLNYLNGALDDVRIYNRALSTQEITQLYNLGK